MTTMMTQIEYTPAIVNWRAQNNFAICLTEGKYFFCEIAVVLIGLLAVMVVEIVSEFPRYKSTADPRLLDGRNAAGTGYAYAAPTGSYGGASAAYG
jgi:hypothetical protein